MSDDPSPLPWTSQQWADLRAAAQESARRSRVASTFLPLVGPLPKDQATVPSNWMAIQQPNGTPLRGEAEERLEVRAGKTLHLVTVSCNVYLRGSDVADPELNAAKAMVRRAAEVLGRVEDAVVFHGLPRSVSTHFTFGDGVVVRPQIYTVTGGRDLTGLLQAADTDFDDRSNSDGAGVDEALSELRRKLRVVVVKDAELAERKAELKEKEEAAANSKVKLVAVALASQAVGVAQRAAATAAADASKAEEGTDIMCVRVETVTPPARSSIVEPVVEAIEKLEARGHFGPFAVVLGHALFADATTPSTSLVLPTDRLAEFLDGRRVLRSGVLPTDEGLVVALGGEPIELVLARDVDITFLQMTLEPRYVLRVFERFVLRIKELDAVCRVIRRTASPERPLLTPGFVARRAGG